MLNLRNLDFSFLVLIFSPRRRGPLCTGVSFPRTRGPSALRKQTPVQNGPGPCGEKIPSIWYSPFSSQIWPNALYVGSLMTKKTYMVLRDISVVQKGHFYDAKAIFNHQGHHNPL